MGGHDFPGDSMVLALLSKEASPVAIGVIYTFGPILLFEGEVF